MASAVRPGTPGGSGLPLQGEVTRQRPTNPSATAPNALASGTEHAR